MKKLNDFPLTDISPYEGALVSRLNDCSSYRTVGFGSARVELEKTPIHTSANIAVTQKVDHETFVKVFKESLKYIAKLSKTAQSILWYIMDNLPKDKAYVIMDNATIMDYCGFKTRKSVWDGIIELLDKNILTRTTIPKKYWVNPLVIFNGNRLTYAKEYILDDAVAC